MLSKDFVNGAVTFIDEWYKNPRIVIPVKFKGTRILAIIDTGAPYCILAPDRADEVGIDRAAGEWLDPPMSTRLGSFHGWLCRTPVTIEPQVGEGTEFETTVFVPDTEEWPPDVNFIGLTNFLFTIHFAVDAKKNLFYFGGPF